MALNKQVHLYGIDTSYFYNKKERRLHDKLNKMYIQKSILKDDKLMKDLPQEIKPLVTPSQLHEWAIDEHPNWNVTSSNFMRSFREREKQRNDYAKLPNETKTLISELNLNMKLENKGDNNV